MQLLPEWIFDIVSQSLFLLIKVTDQAELKCKHKHSDCNTATSCIACFVEPDEDCPALYSLTFVPDYFSQLLKSAIQKEDNKCLQKICESKSFDVEKLIPAWMKFEPLSSAQIKILSGCSSQYIVPANQAKSKMYAFICFTTSGREGALGEASYLHQALQRVGFTTLKLQWSKFEDLRIYLGRRMEEIGSNCSLLFICVMSHGAKGVVCGEDGQYGAVNDIIEMMSFSETLKDVPKVLDNNM